MVKQASFSVLVSFVMLVLFALPVNAEDTKSVLDVRTEYVWRKLYVTAKKNKAMAVASNGAYGIAFDASFLATAESRAMESCNERSKFLSLRQPSTPACRLLASEDDWKLSETIADPLWQDPAPGTDAPMRKGRKYLTQKSKGIILHVHGCNGLGDRIFTDVWGAYFNALGYDFYAPDSFAVKRPKEVCGLANDYPPEQVSTVWRLRIAQTQRTLADLKNANPGKPVYLFGHSEGGLIVQMIAGEVAGIIVSGEECGVFGAPLAADDKVPLLYLWGEFDQFVNGMGFRLTKDSPAKCERDFASHNPQFAILEGRTHIPWPWNTKVNSAVASFLHAEKPLDLKLARAGKRNFADWKRTRVPKTYKSAKPHRAAAIGPGGRSYMVWGLDTYEDASQIALFGCTRTVSKANIFKTGKYACSLVDVNGAAPK